MNGNRHDGHMDPGPTDVVKPPQKRQPAAPLDLVQELLNTVSLMRGYDLLGDGETARRWIARCPAAHRAGIRPSNLPDDELSDLRNLREGLSGVLLTHNAGSAPDADPEALRAVDTAASRSPLRLVLRADGTRTLNPCPGTPITAGAVLAAVAAAPADHWQRLKICANPQCRWSFYDTSRNRRGTWCDMNICGARAKMHRYRASTAPAPATRPPGS
jgi:predicted RNA-binding Zn ribbon-like protein